MLATLFSQGHVMHELTACIEPVAALADGLTASMFELYARYYDAANYRLFLSDLGNKDHVIVLLDRKRQLQGFSTLAVLSFDFEGARQRAIFSGDTIIDQRHWGEQALAFAWIRLAGRIKGQEPDVPLYWFLIVKGHRTYRYLPVFSRSYYPAWKDVTPPREQALMDRLASMRFGDSYDAASGVVSFPSSRGQLKPEWATVPPEDMRKPEVRFFLERNPGYTGGDELVCLTELCPDNLRPLARRLFLRELLC
jgi:hypothetical protein